MGEPEAHRDKKLPTVEAMRYNVNPRVNQHPGVGPRPACSILEKPWISSSKGGSGQDELCKLGEKSSKLGPLRRVEARE